MTLLFGREGKADLISTENCITFVLWLTGNRTKLNIPAQLFFRKKTIPNARSENFLGKVCKLKLKLRPTNPLSEKSKTLKTRYSYKKNSL